MSSSAAEAESVCNNLSPHYRLTFLTKASLNEWGELVGVLCAAWHSLRVSKRRCVTKGRRGMMFANLVPRWRYTQSPIGLCCVEDQATTKILKEPGRVHMQ